ncbi:FAD-dependent oxidoreductase [Achromobacter animicus]|uniref:NAD(P)/FAD-dependent oxidoreductase n=1 Tax=Achromobacter animicus TaxID=1389935 RepID=UPI0028A9B5F7|nr:FAD-dependent oxidoreductase [Achromobacter animicus]
MKHSSVAVVGAGIVGLSVALELQRRGLHVTIYDRNQPMSGCSAGNAGYLSEANIFPPGATGSLLQLSRLLLSKQGPLVIHPAYALRMLPWARRAIALAGAEPSQAIAKILARMTLNAFAATADLAVHAGARSLISRDGGLVVFSTRQGLDALDAKIDHWRHHGVEVEQVNGGQAREMEPSLADAILGGVFFRNAGRCSNPQRLGELYWEHLQRNGARLVRDDVRSVMPASDGGVTLHGSAGSYSSSKAVVCAGFWSKSLLDRFFPSLPLVSERGYHLMLPRESHRLSRPVVFGEPHFAATPMEHGLRLAGTAEFATPTARPNMRRARMLLTLAEKYLAPLDPDGAQPWMGVRPSLPDGMPAIGGVPKHPSIQYAFGHAHNGLTLAAVTAQLIADQMASQVAVTHEPGLDLLRFARAPVANG